MSDTVGQSEAGLGLEAFQQPAEGGLSLDQLNAAFAELLGGGSDPYVVVASEPEAGESAAIAPERAFTPDLPADDDDPTDINPRSILEAILFVGHANGKPLTSREIAALMRGVRAVEIDEIVTDLNLQYRTNQCPYEIVSVGAGYRLSLREAFYAVRDRLASRVRQAKLSAAAVEVLAIVGYNQPIAAEKIGILRGSPSGHLLNQLVRRQLLQVERLAGQRTLTYRTTGRFLEFFGLASLNDLPRSDDLDRQ